MLGDGDGQAVVDPAAGRRVRVRSVQGEDLPVEGAEERGELLSGLACGEKRAESIVGEWREEERAGVMAGDQRRGWDSNNVAGDLSRAAPEVCTPAGKYTGSFESVKQPDQTTACMKRHACGGLWAVCLRTVRMHVLHSRVVAERLRPEDAVLPRHGRLAEVGACGESVSDGN